MKKILLLLIFFGLSHIVSAQAIYYVDKDATGNNDGSSWVNAFTDLQTAIDAAVVESRLVFVKKGIYSISASIKMKEGVKIYGGFNGTEGALNERGDISNTANLTVLDGNKTINHVVANKSNSNNRITRASVLDGFEIKGGNAVGDFPNNDGGGIYNENASPILSNLLISGNSANSAGGGIYNLNSSPLLINVIIRGNSVKTDGGGGIANNNSSPVLIRVTITNNSSKSYGGAMYNELNSTPVLTNVLLSGNSADFFGGGIHNDNSNPELTNVTISGNNADYAGGGMYNTYKSNPNIHNCIILGNSSGIDNDDDSVPNITYSLVQDIAADANNHNLNGTSITAAQVFVNPEEASSAPTSSGDCNLKDTSPAINEGSNMLYENADGDANNNSIDNDKDLAGKPRLYNNEPDPDVIDMGAYERSFSEINIQGNSVTIADGDATPATTDHTDFGSAVVASGSIVRTFTIQNTGTGNLNISSVVISGTNAADFSVTTEAATSVTKSGTTTFKVTFNPSDTSARNATITVNSDDADETAYGFAITGMGTVPEINIQSNSATIADGDNTPSAADHTDFGSTAVTSGSIVRTFTIQNTGTESLSISSVDISGANAADYSITAQPSTTVAASGSTSFEITFNPLSVGVRTATITVNSSDADEAAYNFAIRGTGTDLIVSTTKSEVTCYGGANGSATVSTSGTTGTVTYVWSPSGGNESTANNLTAGNYTVTVTDENETEKATVTITEPAALVFNGSILPNGKYGEAYSATVSASGGTNPYSYSIMGGDLPVGLSLSSEGVISGTPTKAGTFNFNIQAKDKNSCTKKANFTIKISKKDQTINFSPFANKTYGDADLDPDATASSGLAVTYASDNTNVATIVDGKIHIVKAGMATITASQVGNEEWAAADDKKQTLTVDKKALKVTADDKFKVYGSIDPVLTVTYSGFVNGEDKNILDGKLSISREAGEDIGNYIISASGYTSNNYAINYISGTFKITAPLPIIKVVNINGKEFTEPVELLHYTIDCTNNTNSVAISLATSAGASSDSGLQFTMKTEKPGIYRKTITVSSLNGVQTKAYQLVVEKKFQSEQIIEQKFNNVLLVNNNFNNNGGYTFVNYQWYKNGKLVGTKQYYSAGDAVTDRLDPNATYNLTLTTEAGDVLHVCEFAIKLDLQSNILYPNPVIPGSVITVKTGFNTDELEEANIEIYSLSGILLQQMIATETKTTITIPDSLTPGIYLVVYKTAKYKKTFKLVVK